jgi:phosphoenolpyruvate carboxykinase (ATP)
MELKMLSKSNESNVFENQQTNNSKEIITEEKKMPKIDLTKYGITDTKGIIYNPSYDHYCEAETNPELEGFEKGQVSEFGAVNVMTGIFTGRSPKDKFIVMDDVTKATIWWTSDKAANDNKPTTPEVWEELKALVAKQLSSKELYVVDTFCGANEDSRLKVRFIVEVAWQAHFVTNMFLRPTKEELENYGEPDFVVLN